MKCEQVICLECRGRGCKLCNYVGKGVCAVCEAQGACNPKDRNCSVQKLLKLYPKVLPSGSQKSKPPRRTPNVERKDA